MAFRSDNQRKAVFASMKQSAIRGGTRLGHRGYMAAKAKGPGLISKGQAKFREFQKKSPFGSELAIAIPATLIAAAGMSKLKAITKIASVAGKKGALLRGGTELGLAIATDAAVRRTIGGPGKKRKDAAILPAIGASLAAEGGYRLARRRSMKKVAGGLALGGASGAAGKILRGAGRVLT